MNWQEIISLCIVAVAAGLVIRRLFRSSKEHNGCENCALADARGRIRYVHKK